MNAVEELLQLVDDPDPFRNAPQDLQELQLEAARERFAEARERIAILDRRATDTGVDEIACREDVLPLLFAHTNYKSYPDAFVDKGQWAMMNRWLGTLSSREIDVDVEGIGDVDDWIDRLQAGGHHVVVTSGTSGKSSFMNRTLADKQRFTTSYIHASNWAVPHVEPARDRHVFGLLPRTGTYIMCDVYRSYFEEHLGRPETVHYLSTDPLRAMQSIAAGRMRRAIAAGTTGPAEIAEFERAVEVTRARMEEQLAALVELLLEHRHEPITVSGQWATLYRVVQAARARGIRDADFHPDTIVSCGGGVKGAALPVDFREQLRSFFGVPEQNWRFTYGMSEVTGISPWSHVNEAYVMPPWVIPLVLDKTGDRLLAPEDGVVEGRLAILDLTMEGRWGGVISGDKVVLDFNPTPDGIVTPKVRSVARYEELEEGEDKLTCAGTIETYVRGTIGSE